MPGLRAGLLALAAVTGAVAGAVAGLSAPAASAQERLVVPSPVLTIDQDVLFERSAYGARVLAEIAEDSAALAAENRTLETELADEERRLTELRPTTDPEAFQKMAAEFDARVVEVRREQDQKGRDLTRRPDEARQEFFRAAVPVLAELVRERGAVAILDNRAVILSADAIDITADAIRRLDETIGDGTAAPAPQPDPEPSPDPPPEPAPEPAPVPDAPPSGAP
jgi:Skp family chaperone for outer membrane proteins